MRKQISTLLLIVLLAQSSSATPIPKPGIFDGLITIITGIVTNITDFTNTFTTAFNNIFGPNGTFALQNLNNTWTNITQGITGLFNITTISQITGTLINQTLANLNVTFTNLILAFGNITSLLNMTTPANATNFINTLQNINKLINASITNLTSTLKANGMSSAILPSLSILQNLTNTLAQQIQSSSLPKSNLTSMVNGFKSLTSSIISNMAAESTQFATNATLSLLLAQVKNSSIATNATTLATINKLTQKLVNDTKSSVTANVNTMASNIGTFLINLNSITANSVSNIITSNNQLKSTSGTIIDLILTPYFLIVMPIIQVTVNNFNSLLASGYLNAQSQIINLLNNINSTITNATKLIGTVTGNLTSLIAANLTSNLTKIRQCAQTFFPVAQTLIQTSISSVTNCTANVTTTIQSLLTAVNSTIFGTSQSLISQFSAASACLAQPFLTRLGCLKTVINNILNSSTSLQPVLTDLASQIQTTLGNLTQSFQSCINTTISSANASTKALSANFTTCLNA